MVDKYISHGTKVRHKLRGNIYTFISPYSVSDAFCIVEESNGYRFPIRYEHLELMEEIKPDGYYRREF